MQNEGVVKVIASREEAIDEIPVAYIELDLEGRIAKANKAACAMQKMSEAELLGATPWQFMPETRLSVVLKRLLR